MITSDRRLALELQAAREMKQYLSTLPDFVDDVQAQSDVIEAETSLHEAIEAVLNHLSLDEAFLAGIDTLQKKLRERTDRLEHRIEMRRAAIEKAMSLAEIKRLDFPAATITLGAGRRKVIIEDEAKIPARYLVPQPPMIDKTLLAHHLKAGITIDGASLSNGSSQLTIRMA